LKRKANTNEGWDKGKKRLPRKGRGGFGKRGFPALRGRASETQRRGPETKKVPLAEGSQRSCFWSKKCNENVKGRDHKGSEGGQRS